MATGLLISTTGTATGTDFFASDFLDTTDLSTAGFASTFLGVTTGLADLIGALEAGAFGNGFATGFVTGLATTLATGFWWAFGVGLLAALIGAFLATTGFLTTALFTTAGLFLDLAVTATLIGFLTTGFLANGFLATDFFTIGFFTVGFLSGLAAFLGAGLALVSDFLTTGFATAFLTGFLSALTATLAAGFLAAGFLATGFLTGFTDFLLATWRVPC